MRYQLPLRAGGALLDRSIARIPLQRRIASEYRYRESVPDPTPSSSSSRNPANRRHTPPPLGTPEPRHGQHPGHLRAESAIVREAAFLFITRAGPEIGVATKNLYRSWPLALLTLALAETAWPAAAARRSALPYHAAPPARGRRQVLELEPQIEQHRNSQANSTHSSSARPPFGRSPWRGAQALEISYIHAESYAAGELKHGPAGPGGQDMPVIAIARPTSCFTKTQKQPAGEVPCPWR